METLRFGAGIALGILIGFLIFHKAPAPSIPAAEPALRTAQTSTTTLSAEYEWYPVVKVVDGDTITVLKNGKNMTVRLIGVDTPETVDPRKPVQCFGKEASDETKKILGGQYARLELDPSQGEFDKYGRTLAYVYAPANIRPEGILVNEYLISEGYAHEYTYNLPYKYQKEFKAAEVSARTNEKGLWAPGACAGSISVAPKNTLASVSGSYVPSKTYDCTKNSYNCSDFSSHAEAQYVFGLCGGDGNDVHRLDSDKDGSVCEALP
ncbi:thermonuclease family protein [Candidatus Kaiserbacteria bacterium]|nr:thermonuclease family protein [Candidatus Kaiserbacteria bacterium]